MACETTFPALPITTTAGPSMLGFTPSDASLVTFGHSANAHRDTLREVVEAKFQNERSIKEVELTVERAVQKINADLSAVKSELAAQVVLEASRTRDLMRDQAQAEATAAAINAKFSALADAIAKIKTVVP